MSNTATVVINVKDYDNFNPYFNYNTYQAVIPENEVSQKHFFITAGWLMNVT